MPKIWDLTGQRFGRLTAECRAANIGAKTAWLCRCDCGARHVVITGVLLDGRTRSCGCLHRETSIAQGRRNRKHGRSFTPEYQAWSQMKQRCNDPTNRAYAHYGGRGITVCKRWRTSFENFFEDMGERPSSAHSLDRIDNDAGYSKSNCRWATSTQQMRNTRRTKLSADDASEIRKRRANGETFQAIADRFGISTGHAANVTSHAMWKAP